MCLDGSWLDGTTIRNGSLWAWGEWEAESRVLRRLLQPEPQYPGLLWAPYYVRPSEFTCLHNTDPFIFDGFYYTDCKQDSMNAIRRVAQGSVIIFGSVLNNEWVMDTLLVIMKSVEHTHDNYKENLKGIVPDAYWDVTLGPTYEGQEHEKRFRTRTLHIGATYLEPLDGMYSFFPAIAARAGPGFKRPKIELDSKYFNRKLLQGGKGTARTAPSISLSEMRKLWSSIKDQVIAQGLSLGLSACAPPHCGS